MQNIGPLTEFLNSQMPAALEMLRQMVGINSFTANPDGVNRLGRFTAECFAPLGFTAETVPSTNRQWGDHLVLTRRGRSAPWPLPGPGLIQPRHVHPPFQAMTVAVPVAAN